MLPQVFPRVPVRSFFKHHGVLEILGFLQQVTLRINRGPAIFHDAGERSRAVCIQACVPGRSQLPGADLLPSHQLTSKCTDPLSKRKVVFKSVGPSLPVRTGGSVSRLDSGAVAAGAVCLHLDAADLAGPPGPGTSLAAVLPMAPALRLLVCCRCSSRFTSAFFYIQK